MKTIDHLSSVCLCFLTLFSCTLSAQQNPSAQTVPDLPAAEKPAADLPKLSEREELLMKSIGATLDTNGDILLDQARISRRDKIISFPAVTNVRENTIEVLISTEKGRTHESLFISKLDPFKFQLAMILAGFRNGPMLRTLQIPQGSLFDVMVVFPDGKQLKADSLLRNSTMNKEKDDDGYAFVGSNFREGECLASTEGNLININSGDGSTIVNTVLNADNVFNEYMAVPERIPMGKNPEGKETPELHVTIRMVPRAPEPEKSGQAAAEQKPEDNKVKAELLIQHLEETKFSGKKLVYDYIKLESAVNLRVPRENPVTALKILGLKEKLIRDFLALYPKETDDEYYKRAQKILDGVLQSKTFFEKK